MQKVFYLIGTLFFTILLCANNLEAKNKKDKKAEGYNFTNKIEIPTTSVKDQASSGTCWSFATTSFIETEIMRLGNGEHDLSEMFFVRYAYPEKAKKYIRYQGAANFSEGGQAHDVCSIIKEYGLIPEEAYSGLNYGYSYHKHSELVSILSGILDNSLKYKNGFTGKSLEVIDATLNIYLGEVPDTFAYNGTKYTPKSFAKKLEVNPDDYVEFTSYSSYPFFKQVELEVPDNWSHGLYYNLPIDDLMNIINYAFENGFSVNWDGDVSEAGFSHANGIAIIPDTEQKDLEENERLKWESLSDEEKAEMLYDFSKPRNELKVDQAMRQRAFDKFRTTDDHLMHLIGTANDQNGTLYYITKNSWADDSNDMNGKLYMSETYIRLKTIAIQVHKNAVPSHLKEKLSLD